MASIFGSGFFNYFILRLMGKAGAVSYPVLVSSCIVSFTLYSLFILITLKLGS